MFIGIYMFTAITCIDDDNNCDSPRNPRSSIVVYSGRIRLDETWMNYLNHGEKTVGVKKDPPPVMKDYNPSRVEPTLSVFKPSSMQHSRSFSREIYLLHILSRLSSFAFPFDV